MCSEGSLVLFPWNQGSAVVVELSLETRGEFYLQTFLYSVYNNKLGNEFYLKSKNTPLVNCKLASSNFIKIKFSEMKNLFLNYLILKTLIRIIWIL